MFLKLRRFLDFLLGRTEHEDPLEEALDELLEEGAPFVSRKYVHALLEIERTTSKNEHLKTRAFVIVMTAPGWGEAIAAGTNQLVGIIGGTTVAALGGAGYLLYRKAD